MHEPILPALRRMNVPVLWTEVTVWHTGYTDPALRERKLQRDCKILEAKLAERPEVARKTRASRLGWSARHGGAGCPGRELHLVSGSLAC
ncbi:MAG: hypothetical protein ACXVBB_20040 [Isosphaeraceae bacterium]